MSDQAERRVVVTGMGTVNSVAHDIAGFAAALREGRHGFAEVAPAADEPGRPRVMAPVGDFSWRDDLARYEDAAADVCARARRVLRNNTDSTRLGVCAAFQALRQAGLIPGEGRRERIGIVVAGSNLHQRAIWENARRLLAGETINPRHALTFFDSNQVGSLGEIFALHGPGYSVGGASASGNVALFQAWHWLRAGVLDACLVIGANADLSPLEIEAFALLGALGGEDGAADPARACRPFDRGHGGFIPGEGAGALVLERGDLAAARGAVPLGEVLGASMVMDGSHLPESNVEGETRAMQDAIAAAGLTPDAVSYVNAHATSTPLGDRTECAAIGAVFGNRAGQVWVNATKGLIGHCLGAAGVIETIACLVQMEGGFIHPNRNLEEPIDAALRFVGAEAVDAAPGIALANGFGFGGFNSSLVLQRGGA